MKSETAKKIFKIDCGLHAIGLIFLLIGSGVFYKFVYCKLQDQKAVAEQRQHKLSLLLSNSGQIKQEHLVLRKELHELQDSIAAVRERLPQKLDEDVFMAEARKTAQQVGLDILDYQTEFTEAGNGLPHAEVRLTCNGSYASMTRFLDKISQFTRVTEISKLAVESDVNSQRYPIQISFVLYYGASSHDKKKGEIL